MTADLSKVREAIATARRYVYIDLTKVCAALDEALSRLEQPGGHDDTCKHSPSGRHVIARSACQYCEEEPGGREMPEEPTQSMLIAARDWSYQKYGRPIGDDAARGCWRAMYAALRATKESPDA